MRELILGGGRSGKSRCAESRAKTWLQVPGRRALLIATALRGDEEMRDRISRHQTQRALHVPALQTLEVPHDLPSALREWCSPQRLVMVDCLTLWVVQQLMPLDGSSPSEPAWQLQLDALCAAVHDAARPVILVSNELGMGVTPWAAMRAATLTHSAHCISAWPPCASVSR